MLVLDDCFQLLSDTFLLLVPACFGINIVFIVLFGLAAILVHFSVECDSILCSFCLFDVDAQPKIKTSDKEQKRLN